MQPSPFPGPHWEIGAHIWPGDEEAGRREEDKAVHMVRPPLPSAVSHIDQQRGSSQAVPNGSQAVWLVTKLHACPPAGRGAHRCIQFCCVQAGRCCQECIVLLRPANSRIDSSRCLSNTRFNVQLVKLAVDEMNDTSCQHVDWFPLLAECTERGDHAMPWENSASDMKLLLKGTQATFSVGCGPAVLAVHTHLGEMQCVRFPDNPSSHAWGVQSYHSDAVRPRQTSSRIHHLAAA